MTTDQFIDGRLTPELAAELKDNTIRRVPIAVSVELFPPEPPP